MFISYNWLKWYIPEVPNPETLRDIFTYHLCEVEEVEKKENDFIFDINILPNRAHDLLSHRGVARELASLLNIKFVDPRLLPTNQEGGQATSKYKIPESKPTELKIDVQSEKCRRYIGRIVRNVKVGLSPEWVVKHLESIGQRSINNLVDAANLVMYDCGQPTHIFDLDKTKNELVIRQAKDGEEMTTLDNKEVKLKNSDMVIAASPQPRLPIGGQVSPDRRGSEGEVLAVAGIKGGKIAEVDESTKNIVLEVANFDPTSVRKTAQSLNIFTDARKRFENDLSPELGLHAMLELSSLILEMCPEAVFEDVVDVYPKKQEARKLSFSAGKISKILGLVVSEDEIKNILEKYKIEYNLSPNPSPDRRGAGGEVFEITVPPMRLDLTIEEDMAEEIGRIMGYDKIKPEISKIDFKPKQNEVHSKILFARNKLIQDGYSEVMNTSFSMKGEVEVLASASDKNFLRTNLTDGLKESLKLNQVNAPLLGMNEIKIFEIGTVFTKKGSSSAQGFEGTMEEMHVAYGDKKGIKEITLEEFASPRPTGTPPQKGGDGFSPLLDKEGVGGGNLKFKMWSLFPFIARDIAVWAPEGVESYEILKIIKENAGEMIVRGPELFDEFKKDGKISYAFRLVFQSYDRTLTDAEVNEIMNKINEKIGKKDGWQAR